MNLTLYDQARRALGEAVRVDEVLTVRDQAERLRLYARQAKDRELMADAMELQLRAERRLGELLTEAKAAGQLDRGGRPGKQETDTKTVPVSLAAIGIERKLSAASQKLAQVPAAEFEAGISRSRDKIVSGAAVVVNPTRDLTQAEKKTKRAQREAELGARQMALPSKRYGVILADPEWRFETFSRDTGMDRAADNHYPTSPLEDIKRRDVPSIAAGDAVLLLWATVPMLPQALEVMEAWGFAYKSGFVWIKDAIGTGFWNRNQHEHLLLGTQGSIPAPAMGTQFSSVFAAAVGAHSEKPDFAHELAETYFPNLPKIELNARRARTGWDAWGLEAPNEESAA